MKLWLWFLSGSLAGLLGASLLTTVQAGEPVPGLRTLRGSHPELGQFQLREYSGGRWEMIQDLNRCEINETEEGVESFCTQVAPAYYALSTAMHEHTDSENRMVLKTEGRSLPFKFVLVEDFKSSQGKWYLNFSGTLPGPFGVFKGAAQIELK